VKKRFSGWNLKFQAEKSFFAVEFEIPPRNLKFGRELSNSTVKLQIS